MAEHGDAKLTDLLATLVDYPKAGSVTLHGSRNSMRS
jgi:hypothetical protein